MDSILVDLSLDGSAADPLHQQLSGYLKGLIVAGRVEAGRMLPSEHAMCRELGISRVTVRRAVDDLVAEGLVQRQAGKGMIVIGRSKTAGAVDRPWAGASHLKQTGRHGRISLIVANTIGSFMSSVIQGVDEILREAGVSLAVSVSDDDFERERQSLDAAVAQGVDGMLIYSVSPRDGVNPNCYHYLRLQEQGLPLLLLDRYFPQLPLGHVCGDDAGNMRLLTSQLLRLGHRKLGLIYSDLNLSSVRGRYQGFIDALIANHEKPAVVIEAGTRHSGLDDIQLGRLAIERLLRSEQPLPETLMACNSYLAIGAQRALRDAGVDVPSQVAVIGYEDVPEARALDVPLTVMDVPVSQIGREAAAVLLKLIRQHRTGRDVRIELPGRLIVRQSCGTSMQAWDESLLAAT